jgi:hypothetical protein
MQPGKRYKVPVSSIDSGKWHEFKAPEYERHVYGQDELGGTQVMYMSAVPFEKFGLPSFPKESFVSMASGIQYAIYKGMVYPLVVLAGLIFMANKHKNSDEAEESASSHDQGEDA